MEEIKAIRQAEKIIYRAFSQPLEFPSYVAQLRAQWKEFKYSQIPEPLTKGQLITPALLQEELMLLDDHIAYEKHALDHLEHRLLKDEEIKDVTTKQVGVNTFIELEETNGVKITALGKSFAIEGFADTITYIDPRYPTIEPALEEGEEADSLLKELFIEDAFSRYFSYANGGEALPKNFPDLSLLVKVLEIKYQPEYSSPYEISSVHLCEEELKRRLYHVQDLADH